MATTTETLTRLFAVRFHYGLGGAVIEEEDRIRRRMMALSDDDLRRVVGAERDDWRPEALAVARQELSRRGIHDAEDAQALTVPESDPRRPNYAHGVPIVLLVALLLKVLHIVLRY